MPNFKPGDKVYFPTLTTKILTVTKVIDFPESQIVADGFKFTLSGKVNTWDANPSIFLATEENRKKLQDLYGVEFAEPRKEPPNAEIIKAMLERGDKFIMCYVSDNYEEPDGICQKAIIDGYDPDALYPFLVADEAGWKYATPIDSRGNRITEADLKPRPKEVDAYLVI